MTANHGTQHDPTCDRLFAPDDTQPKLCTHCGSTNPAICGYNHRLKEGWTQPGSKRPKSCLYSPQLGPNDPLPEGF